MSVNPRIIVLDLETQKGFHEIDRKKLHLLKCSVVCIHDSATDSYHSFEEKELAKLEEVLKRADVIVGFNIRDFDMPVLAPYLITPIERFPVLDLMVEIEKSRGHRVSLQSLVQPTLGVSKSGTGWDALQLYKDCKLDELKKYCTDDVRLTKELYEYGLVHGKVLFQSNRDFQTYEVPVNWDAAVKELTAKKETGAFPTSLF